MDRESGEAIFAAWLRIFRDFVVVLLACFILIYETVRVPSPSPELLAVALVLLGLPPVLRLDEKRRKNGNGG